MSKDYKFNEREDKYFTKELMGVMLILFSLLSFLCLSLGKHIFFEVGEAIQRFFLGFFGLAAYPLFICFFVFGFKIVFDKKIMKKQFVVFFVFGWLIFLSAMALVSAVNFPDTLKTFKEYIDYAYQSASEGGPELIAGGVLLTIPTALISKYLSRIGAIVVYSILIILWFFLFIKCLVDRSKTRSYPGKFDDSGMENNNNNHVDNVNLNPNANNYVQTPNYSQVTPNYIQSSQTVVAQNIPPQPYYSNAPTNQGGNVGYKDQYASNAIFPESGFKPGFNGYNDETITSNNNGSNYPHSVSSDEANEILFGDRQSNINTNDYPVNNNEKISSSENVQELKSEKKPVIIQKVEEEFPNNYPTPNFNEILKENKSEVEPKQEIVQQNTQVSQKQEYIDAEKFAELQNGGDRNLFENMPINFTYNAPPISLLHDDVNSTNRLDYEMFKKEKETVILDLLAKYGINTKMAAIHSGPAFTRYDIIVPDDVRVNRIISLNDDLNLRIAAKMPIRMVSPVPGTSYVGIEVANPKAETVTIKDLLPKCSEYVNAGKNQRMFVFGKDVVGKPIGIDICEMPHALVSGTTGSGKSVCLNTMIVSLIMKYGPDDLRFIIIDPKNVDFSIYEQLPHMMFNHIIPKDLPLIISTLNWVIDEMERRNQLFHDNNVRKISDYNNLARNKGLKKLPSIVFIIDEFTDLMISDKKNIGEKITLLTAKARSTGIHLILASQRPSSDIVNGPIKSNLPTRMVFRAVTRVDSDVAAGEPCVGAEYLLGKGDCLIKTTENPQFNRVMGAYIDDNDIMDVIKYAQDNNKAYFNYNAWDKITRACSASSSSDDNESGGAIPTGMPANGELDQLAITSLAQGIMQGGISISAIQRWTSVGYPRAGKIIDQLTRLKYVSTDKVNGKNKVLISKEDFIAKYGDSYFNE